MFRKISENAESDSEGKNSQFCKKISQKPYFLIALKTGDIFGHIWDHQLYFMAVSKPLSR